MGLSAHITRHELEFKKPATTSRGVYAYRNIWLLHICNAAQPTVTGIGECAPLTGLSIDDVPDYETQLNVLVDQINRNKADNFDFKAFPSIKFGLETALLDLKNGGRRIIFQNLYAIGKLGIPINGLIWMDNLESMKLEALDKINKGFDCIKLKIGALDFNKECELLEFIRSQKNGDKLIVRVDANGAFDENNVFERLQELKQFNIHSIEQPVKAGQWELMREIVHSTPVPVALDEELIGYSSEKDMEKLISTIRPQYIVIKPNLLGGFVQSDAWIKMAEKYNTGWWITSALESNIGLNAIAQYAANFNSKVHSGLGTGHLYEGNFAPFTNIRFGYLWKDMGTVASDNQQAPGEK